MPRTTASAYFCRPSGLIDQRGIGGVLHVAQLDQDGRELRQVEPGDVGPRVQAPGADVVGGRDARAASWSRMVRANCTAGPAWASLSGGDE